MTARWYRYVAAVAVAERMRDRGIITDAQLDAERRSLRDLYRTSGL